MGAYDEHLAYIHDQGYAEIVEAAAVCVLEVLASHASIVELGCGSGVTARRLTDAGHKVLGIDQSAALIALARGRAPRARCPQRSTVVPRACCPRRAAPRRPTCLRSGRAWPRARGAAAATGRPAAIGPCSSRPMRRVIFSRAASRASANAARATGAARRSTASACTGRAEPSRCCAPRASVWHPPALRRGVAWPRRHVYVARKAGLVPLA